MDTLCVCVCVSVCGVCLCCFHGNVGVSSNRGTAVLHGSVHVSEHVRAAG